MSFELARIIAEADTIVCIGVMHGTHDGPSTAYRLPASPRPFGTSTY
jgi:hypothetical protein